MTFFQKKVISNALTKLIDDNPNTDIEKILLNENFSPTIRNESDILYRRILLNKGMPWMKDNKAWNFKGKEWLNDNIWFDTILRYALFDKEEPKEYKEDNSVKQINKNSSNFLENCGKKFMNYFIQDVADVNLINYKELQKKLQAIITEFISSKNKSINTNPMYAGHFQRFIENFLRWKALNPDKIIPQIALFLVSNCRILAYQQLITRLICDYCADAKEGIIYDLLTQILNRCYIAVKYVRTQKDPNLTSTAVSVTKQINKVQKVNEDNQPLNSNKEPIPLIGLVFDKTGEVQDLNENKSVLRIPWKKSVELFKESQIKYENIEDAEIDAYLLILSIRCSISDQVDVINYFRDEDSQCGYPLIQALLYCGTRSPVKSLISLEVFRLLSIIFNGSNNLSIDPWKFLEDEKSELDFYTRFADEMVFDPTCLTYKMIHALPVFWGHRYNKDEYEMSPEEQEKVDTCDYYQDNKKHTRVREEGETALEILQPCLFCEPPISSQLIYLSTDIFIQLSKQRLQLTELESKTKKDRDLMLKFDGIVLDFYQHHFTFGNKYPNITFYDLLKTNIIFPLVPMDKIYQEETKKRRSALSGFAVDFLLRMSSMRTNTFFQIDKDTLTKIASKSCFNCYELSSLFTYSDFTHFETLKKSTLYNKPIHSDFYFENDENAEEEDENEARKHRAKVVIVDEMDKGYHKLYDHHVRKVQEDKEKKKIKIEPKDKKTDKASEKVKDKTEDKDKNKAADKDKVAEKDKAAVKKVLVDEVNRKSSNNDDDNDEDLLKSMNESAGPSSAKPKRSIRSMRPKRKSEDV